MSQRLPHRFDLAVSPFILPRGWRRAEGEEDAEFACRLVERTMSPYWARRQMRFSPKMFMQQWQGLDALILEHHGVASGVIAWDIKGEYAYLRELHLSEAVRGQGRGRLILEAWIARRRSEGVHGLRLKVFAENPARELYARVGFDVSGGDPDIEGLLDMQRTI
ncbi:GNAT family N-acetyltransferase [Halotalea alkalilenta]|uniref:N-acetyltransferase domain-containing protein n=1 Tax=Halotalea alkalilenta TaxID=376489 RepID=A0A172YFB3_9GAMM|nr:GNAT family N-acetyltransferase [Halotalea alkalilenta]ANF57762.1 hypothetical protein A5892_10030 [Halotalea alkalilenta]